MYVILMIGGQCEVQRSNADVIFHQIKSNFGFMDMPFYIFWYGASYEVSEHSEYKCDD